MMQTPGRDKHSESVRNDIAESAARLFFSKGYEGATVKDIAQASGASVGSIYHFFGNKEGVFAHLIRHVFGLTTVLTEHLMADVSDARVRMGFQMATQVMLISKEQQLAQFYEMALHSRATAQLTQELAMQRHLSLFPDLALDAEGLQEAAGVCVVINGVIGALVQERLTVNHMAAIERVRWLLRTVLPLVDPRQDQVAAIGAQVEALLDKWIPTVMDAVNAMVGFTDICASPE
jgi:AcrR family transcriptional regulator